MSLRPDKKSDLDKQWMIRRVGKNKQIHPEYHLIVTEGIKTEPKYFGAVRNRINSKYRERIQLEVVGAGDNTVGIFERAKALAEANLNGYKHVWIVYDTDDFPKEKINLVAELCQNNSTQSRQYHAIWSNQCIELWFLLHFSFMHSDLHRTEYFPKLTECLSIISKGKYTKNRDDIFDVLEPYLDAAIANAKALNEINKDKTPAESAPGTKVYELMEKLKPYI